MQEITEDGVWDISIHAPTRGATVLGLGKKNIINHFNPRSHERSDAGVLSVVLAKSVFQSTLPREERLALAGWKTDDMLISIHAPTRGATCPRHSSIVL